MGDKYYIYPLSREERKKYRIKLLVTLLLLIGIIVLKIKIFDNYEPDDKISTGVCIVIGGYFL